MFLLFLAQAAAAAPPPDIQLDIRATAREVRIRQQGETSLSVHAEPDAGSLARTEKPDATGRNRLRDVDVRVHAEARVADPKNPAETPEPQ